jgi:hypothetical protein
MKNIPLTQGKFAIVDDEDYEELSKYKWTLSNGYAIKTKYRKAILMHRIINKTPDNLFTDHKNGNKLDNRKENLRTCSTTENNRNSRKHKNCLVEYKGVTIDNNKYRKNKYKCQIKTDDKLIYLGNFKTSIDAAIVYNNAAKQYHGEFANLNKI